MLEAASAGEKLCDAAVRAYELNHRGYFLLMPYAIKRYLAEASSG